MHWPGMLVASAALAATVSGTLPSPRPPRGTGSPRAGAARVDITPLPGFPMGGYSIVGRRARGYWGRLYARALYVEDAEGRPLLLVSCDLWSVPGGLSDRVAETVARSPEGRHIGRADVLVAATHTHHSPGNFSTSPSYNQLASAEPGFDPALFARLARGTADAALQAVRNATRARLHWGRAAVPGLARNRSFEAFLLDPEAPRFLQRHGGLAIPGPIAHVAHADAYRAVDPHVRVLRAVAAGDGRTIGVAAFAAVHPTAMGPDAELYGADVFGVAASLAEGRLAAGGNPGAVGAIFSGAEGDVSPNRQEQGRADALRLGRLLERGIAEALAAAAPPAAAGGELTVESRWRKVRLAGRRFAEPDGTIYRTAARAAVGAAALGGAEDGRTFLHALGWREGLQGEPSAEQGRKADPYNPFRLKLEVPWFVAPLLSWLAPGEPEVPREVPLAVHRIGPLAFATVPGEATTILGERIRARVAQAHAARGVEVGEVVVVGLANEYLSYFTTPEEYAAQHYEGG